MDISRWGRRIAAFAVRITVWIMVVVVCLASTGVVPAAAAERVLEPDRIYANPSEPKPIEPLLAEGENMRSGTRYLGKTQAMEVSPSDAYRGFLFLVNYQGSLPEGYVPEGLADAGELTWTLGEAGFSVTKAGMEIHRTVGEKLLDLILDARSQGGVSGYLLQSGYRDYDYQAALHQRKVQEYRGMGYSDADARKAAA
ncbi:MAG: hypothetical protein FWF83_03650, partial [Clostridiales bacterium]|nr:hypothetical protein [Clostridiales bacterium]